MVQNVAEPVLQLSKMIKNDQIWYKFRENSIRKVKF